MDDGNLVHVDGPYGLVHAGPPMKLDEERHDDDSGRPPVSPLETDGILPALLGLNEAVFPRASGLSIQHSIYPITLPVASSSSNRCQFIFPRSIDLISSPQKEKMSAPYPGRQSPDPETQSDQQQAPLASGKTPAEYREESKSMAQRGAQNLKSNPEHPLEKIMEAKFSKGPGN